MSTTNLTEVAKTIYALNPDIQPWNGDPYEYDETERTTRYHKDLADRQAQALAHLLTPT